MHSAGPRQSTHPSAWPRLSAPELHSSFNVDQNSQSHHLLPLSHLPAGQQLRAVQTGVPFSQKPSNVNTGIRKMGLEAFGGFASNYRSVPDLEIQQHHSHFPPCSTQLLIAFAHLSAQFFISRLCLINPARGSSAQNTQAALSSPVPSAKAAELKLWPLHRGISP